RRVTQQTGKGKIHRMYTLIVVGDGNGLVGFGEGKDEEAPRAAEKALAEAVRNMDYVERFEDRTIWTDMEAKLGGTRILLRPRPVGFGLQCNPNVHQVLKAAGIKDVSAKVWGSRTPLNVIKALFRMLHAGNAPLAMGDGVGGRGRRMEKGSGLRSKDAMERERGRRIVDLRTW
ncbi:ribosomal protein S5 domain 2-like protein, partial [Coniophora puteana RWD-64-598 SS2]